MRNVQSVMQHEAGENVPEGRVLITGTVLAFKVQSLFMATFLRCSCRMTEAFVCGVQCHLASKISVSRASRLPLR